MAGLKLLTKGTNLMCINFKFFTSPDFWIAHHFIHRTMNIHYISYHHSILKHLMYQKRTWKRFDRWALLITIWGVTSCESSTWKWDFSKWCDILTKGNGDSGWKPTNAFKCVCRREWKWLHDCTKWSHLGLLNIATLIPLKNPLKHKAQFLTFTEKVFLFQEKNVLKEIFEKQEIQIHTGLCEGYEARIQRSPWIADCKRYPSKDQRQQKEGFFATVTIFKILNVIK